MCEKCSENDYLVQAIHRALDGGDAVSVAYDEASNAGVLSSAQKRRGAELVKEIRAGTIFGSTDLDEIREYAAAMEPGIRQGTRKHFVPDENDMSGGHDETITTEGGMALIGLRSALVTLAERISVVRNRLHAIRIADDLMT